MLAMPLDLNGVSKTDYATLLKRAETKYQPDEYYFSVDDESDIYWYTGDGDVNRGYDVNIMRHIVDYAERVKGYEVFVKRLFILQIKYLICLGFWKNYVKSKNIRNKLLTTLGESLRRKLNYKKDRSFIMKVNNIRKYEDAAEHYLFPMSIIILHDVEDINYTDEEFLLTFANHDRSILKKISKLGMKPSRDFVLELVKHYGFELRYAGSYKNDREIVRMAVFGPPEFEDNARECGRWFELGKTFGDPTALQFASNDIKNDKEFIFELFMDFERRHFLSHTRKRKLEGQGVHEAMKRLYKRGKVPSLRDISALSLKLLDYDQLKEYYYGKSVDTRTVNEDFLQWVWERIYYSHRKLNWQRGTYRDLLRDVMIERLMIANWNVEGKTKLRF